ncbi:glycosyltransferase family 2 protein, partial [Salegentibacter sp.]
MPAYNAESFIEASIQSVREQTYSNWELLVIDDASEDQT